MLQKYELGNMLSNEYVIGENVIPLIDPDKIKGGRKNNIKVHIPLISIDNIGKKISSSAGKYTKKDRRQTTEHKKEHRKSNRNRENEHERWLIFRTTLAPNIRLREQFIYDKTGVLSVSSGFIGDKRRVNLPIIDID
jgi:hypothetical protein